MSFIDHQNRLNNFRSYHFEKLLEFDTKLERLETAGYPPESLEILSLKREYGKDTGGLLDQDEALVIACAKARAVRDAGKPKRRRSDDADAERAWEKQKFGHFDPEAGYMPKAGSVSVSGGNARRKYKRPGDQ
jgi:hypothetical protein